MKQHISMLKWTTNGFLCSLIQREPHVNINEYVYIKCALDEEEPMTTICHFIPFFFSRFIKYSPASDKIPSELRCSQTEIRIFLPRKGGKIPIFSAVMPKRNFETCKIHIIEIRNWIGLGNRLQQVNQKPNKGSLSLSRFLSHPMLIRHTAAQLSVHIFPLFGYAVKLKQIFLVASMECRLSFALCRGSLDTLEFEIHIWLLLLCALVDIFVYNRNSVENHFIYDRRIFNDSPQLRGMFKYLNISVSCEFSTKICWRWNSVRKIFTFKSISKSFIKFISFKNNMEQISEIIKILALDGVEFHMGGFDSACENVIMLDFFEVSSEMGNGAGKCLFLKRERERERMERRREQKRIIHTNEYQWIYLPQNILCGVSRRLCVLNSKELNFVWQATVTITKIPWQSIDGMEQQKEEKKIQYTIFRSL